MSNRLSVVRTLHNSENVRASMGENMQFHGKIMNFASLTPQPWQGIYIGNSYWSWNLKKLTFMVAPNQYKTQKDSIMVTWHYKGQQTWLTELGLSPRVSIKTVVIKWILLIDNENQWKSMNKLAVSNRYYRFFMILTIYNGRGGIVRKRRRERPKPHCLFFSLLLFFLTRRPHHLKHLLCRLKSSYLQTPQCFPTSLYVCFASSFVQNYRKLKSLLLSYHECSAVRPNCGLTEKKINITKNV